MSILLSALRDAIRTIKLKIPVEMDSIGKSDDKSPGFGQPQRGSQAQRAGFW